MFTMGTSGINIPFIFLHIVCAVVSPTGSRPPSRNRNNEMPGDEELGFEAAVAALGKTNLSPPSGLDSLSLFAFSLSDPVVSSVCFLLVTRPSVYLQV